MSKERDIRVSAPATTPRHYLATLSVPAPLGTSTLPAQIHESLEEAIIRGDIAPGSRLRADDIASHYGVSRIPVREALSSLHEAGWVGIRPRYGVYVRERSEAELTELFEARSGIEGYIAGLAAERRRDENVAELTRIVSHTKDAAAQKDVDALSLASVEFNAALRATAHNTVLAAVSLGLEKRARFYFSPIAGLIGDEWVESQARLVDFITRGQAEEASASARQHIVQTGEAVARLLGDVSFSS